MLTVTRMTVREFYSKKVLILAVALSLVYLGFYWYGLHMYAIDIARSPSPNPILQAGVSTSLLVLGIYLASFMINFLAVFLSVGAISSEIDTGTIQALVAAPVKRRSIILGKFLGYSLGMFLFSLLFISAILLINRYTNGFASSLTVGSVVLFCLQPVVLVGISLLGSCVLPTLGNGVAVMMLYLVGIVGGIIEQVGVLVKNASLVNAGIITSLIIPVDVLYRKSVELLLRGADNPLQTLALNNLGPLGSLSSPSQWMLVYAVLYLVAFVGGGIAAFNRKDL
ncbi:MAG: ABC transporter permease [Firmicutes bacterium]|nr:ABC transporter permease [Bacillota bacterium]